MSKLITGLGYLLSSLSTKKMYFDFNGVLIENPIGNSNKLNKINSISPKNKFHDEAIM